jgi:hypothetical protein
VGAASEVLGLPVESILQVFGEHWVLKTASKNYGAMLRAGGATLKEFLVNLPNFHTRVAMLYPNLVPPSFVCADVTESGLTLHYHTHRLGLTHFVIGILTGLGKLYECPCVTQVVASRSDGASHDVFAVRW